MPINDATRALGLPSFRPPTAAPPPPTADSPDGIPPAPATADSPHRLTLLQGPDSLPKPPSLKPAGADGEATRTATSSAGEGLGRDPKHLAKILAGLVGLLFVVGDGLLRRYSQRGLRTPTKQQTQDFARPLAAIIHRHADGLEVMPDVADVVAAGSAAGDYLLDGPLTVPASRREMPDEYRDAGDVDDQAPRVMPPDTAPMDSPAPPPMIPPPPARGEHVTYLS